jgi:Ferritin-like
MKSSASALASLSYKRPASHSTPLGFALPSADPMTQAIDAFGLPVIPAGYDTPLKRALYLLQAAAEIEHGLLIQYLYAAYSIDPSSEEWVGRLTAIAVQEMFHLLCVQNLARLLKGGQLYFDRANFPVPAAHLGAYPFPFKLEPLSDVSLAKYVTTESPYPITNVPVEIRATVQTIWGVAGDAIKMEGAKCLGHVGMLYLALYWLFLEPNATPVPGTWQGAWPPPGLVEAQYGHLEPTDFADLGPVAVRQGTSDDFGGKNGPNDGPTHRVVWKVISREEALRCIYQIAAQGEGVESAENSHFLQFFNVYKQFSVPVAAGGGIPVLNLPKNPRVADFPADVKPWGDLFNNRYRMLLLKLPLALSQPQDLAATNIDSRKLLTKHMKSMEMKGLAGIQGLTQTLIGRKAAPPFELPEDATLFGIPDGLLPVELNAVKKGLITLIDEAGKDGGLVDQIFKLASSGPTVDEAQALKDLKTDDAALRAVLAPPAPPAGGATPSGT